MRIQILAQETQSAGQIVAATCAFWEDDITVLSIQRLAVAEERDQARVSLAAEIAAVWLAKSKR